MKLPAPEATSVRIRELRGALAEYIDAEAPLTITRHGGAVGWFIPLRRPNAEDVQRMRDATARVQEVMPLSDREIEELVADFEALRRASPMRNVSAKDGSDRNLP